MVSVEEAEAVILQHLASPVTISCDLESALGMTLTGDLIADRDLPPFNRVTMDGIAFHTDAWNQGQRTYNIAGTQAAGATPMTLEQPGTCLNVMTGAVLPAGVNCVFPKEVVHVEDSIAVLGDEPCAQSMLNVHQQGSDAKKGAKLVGKGTVLSSPTLLIAASIGATQVEVFKPLSVALVSNGDELVPIDEQPGPHQIRRSNTYGLQGACTRMGLGPITLAHFPDDKAALLSGVANLIEQHDMIVITGGVSAGDFDYLPEVLEELKVEKKFHKVNQRPGRPFWFGIAPGSKPVFALPGNPVSTLICFHRYVVPWLNRSFGKEAHTGNKAMLTSDYSFSKPLTCFLQVKDQGFKEGIHQVIPAMHHGSGDFSSLADTSGFVELKADQDSFSAGTIVPYFPWL